MAVKIKALNDEQRETFTRFYRWYEKFHAMDGTPEDWLEAVKASNEAYIDCGGSRLALHLSIALIDAISDEQKRREAESIRTEQTVMTDEDGRPVTF